LGTRAPNRRVSFAAAAGPGNGFGQGVAGNAKTPFTGIALVFPAAAFVAELFSAAFASLPAALLFRWPHSGNAKNALSINPRHALRISVPP
jgi:hypothetical protein